MSEYKLSAVLSPLQLSGVTRASTLVMTHVKVRDCLHAKKKKNIAHLCWQVMTTHSYLLMFSDL